MAEVNPRIQTLTEFVDVFVKYSSRTGSLKCYRGQRNASWKMEAGLFRPDLKKLEENEKRATRDLMSVHPHEFAPDATMFDKLVRMQHFGLPTRLLDVSLNALVALYFATEVGPDGKEADGIVIALPIPPEREKYFDSDSVSCLSNLSNMTKSEKEALISLHSSFGNEVIDQRRLEQFNKDPVIERLHQFIRAEKPYFLPIIQPTDLFNPYYVHPKLSNRRILAQAGAFIIFGVTPPGKMKQTHPIKPDQFIIPKDKKATIRSALENLGINESTLFPEIDKAAKRITEKYTKV